ncbi:hypothetical protein TBK1r_51780 [Stieleria magnilauensis]|uniref:Uncharacterized protein n=1 Tax=Stieleria magnilauensis TaxID=2527963 RepID=A0ABX5XVV0_9BACT|nr:hypothetical protein TBK1r_51780 [Planctomycetes bacterium TBK1r]
MRTVRGRMPSSISRRAQVTATSDSDVSRERDARRTINRQLVCSAKARCESPTGSPGAEPPRLTNNSRSKPAAHSSPYVFWLSPSRTDAVTRDPPVAVREKARGEKRPRAIVNTKCVDFND